MAVERATVIGKMRQAFREGLSASRFIQQMQVEGLSYRRSDMLSDWRSVNEIEKKEGAMRFVRKDRYPAERSLAEVEWKLDKEYLYTVKVKSQLRAGEPITERFVNIISDNPLTPLEVEEQVVSAWGKWEDYAKENITGLQVWTAWHKVT